MIIQTGQLKKGLGDGGPAIEEAIYEGYGPFGTAFLIEAATDNKNRTVSNIKHILSKMVVIQEDKVRLLGNLKPKGKF